MEFMESVVAVIAISAPFLMVAAIVIIPRWFKAREREQLQQTLRVALEKGQPLDPEVVAAIGKDIKPVPSAQRDLRNGVIWLAVGVGIAAFSFFQDFRIDADGVVMDFGGGLTGIAAIPIVIGLAFIVLSFFNKNKG